MENKRTQVALRFVSKLSIGIAALLLVIGMAPVGAFAHAEITTSTPAEGSTVNAGMTQMTLNFSEEISPEQSSAQVIGPDGTAIANASSAVDRAKRTVMNVTTPALAS